MKSIIKVSIVVLATAFSFNASADDSIYDGLTCVGKEKAIQTQIDIVKKVNNSYRLKGLEKALSDIQTYCTDKD